MKPTSRSDRTCEVRGLLFGALIVAFVNVGALRAGEPPSDRMLEERGLRRAGSLLVLRDETAIHETAHQLHGLYRELSHAVARRNATLGEKEYQASVRELTAELKKLRTRHAAVDRSMNRLRRGRVMRRGRRRVRMHNAYQIEEYQQLGIFRQVLNREITQRQAFLNQLKHHPVDPKARARADAAVTAARADLRQGINDLRAQVAEARAKYEQLAKDPKVKTWLETPEGPAGVKPKLGPSPSLRRDEQLLERFIGKFEAEARTRRAL